VKGNPDETRQGIPRSFVICENRWSDVFELFVLAFGAVILPKIQKTLES
jgi:hypothetical protein